MSPQSQSRAKSFDQPASKAQFRHDLSGEGCAKDYAARDVKDWKQPQRKSEGRGYAPMDAVTASHTYTGKGGRRNRP